MQDRGQHLKNAPSDENHFRHFVAALLACVRRLPVSIRILQRSVGGSSWVIEFRFTLHRPMVDVAFATVVLGRGRKEVMALIETGEILWAWNLALYPDSSSPCIRIYAQSLVDYLQKKPAPTLDDSIQFQGITQQIFKGYGKTITAKQLKVAFGVGSDHIHKLWHADYLKIAPGSRCFHGPGGSPAFELSSAIGFLTQRRHV